MNHIQIQVNNKDNKWLSLRGNKINKQNNIDFDISQINHNINRIIDTEFILKFSFKNIYDRVDIDKNKNDDVINWIIL